MEPMVRSVHICAHKTVRIHHVTSLHQMVYAQVESVIQDSREITALWVIKHFLFTTVSIILVCHLTAC